MTKEGLGVKLTQRPRRVFWDGGAAGERGRVGAGKAKGLGSGELMTLASRIPRHAGTTSEQMDANRSKA